MKRFELKAVCEPQERYGEEFIITGAMDVYNLMMSLYGDDKDVYETLYALFLNKANKVNGYSALSKGGIDQTCFDVRLLCKTALDSLCSGVVLVHNHPSGSVTPSGSDISITERAKMALGLFDIELVDHVIIGEGKFFSYTDDCSTDVKGRKAVTV